MLYVLIDYSQDAKECLFKVQDIKSHILQFADKRKELVDAGFIPSEYGLCTVYEWDFEEDLLICDGFIRVGLTLIDRFDEFLKVAGFTKYKTISENDEVHTSILTEFTKDRVDKSVIEYEIRSLVDETTKRIDKIISDCDVNSEFVENYTESLVALKEELAKVRKIANCKETGEECCKTALS